MASEKLAINGGQPAITPVAKRALKPWPLPDARTAERLKQVYLSGHWSFNGPCEQEFSRKFAAYCGARHGIFHLPRPLAHRNHAGNDEAGAICLFQLSQARRA